MNLFNMFNRNSKDEINSHERNKKSKGGTLFRTINTIAILGIFLALGLFVLSIFGLLKFSATTFGLIGTVLCLCVGCWLMLPWLAYLEQKKNKIVSIVFICLNILIPVLWTFAIWFLIAQTKSGAITAGTLTFVKYVIIISLQFAVVSFIANTITRYGKKFLVLQVVAYISYIYFDFYLSYALACISFTANDGIVFSGALNVLGNKILLMFFVLSLLYVIISNNFLGRRYQRKRSAADVLIDMLPDGQGSTQEPTTTVSNTESQSIEEQLQTLQNLLDKNLITQEEYNKKREDLLNKL